MSFKGFAIAAFIGMAAFSSATLRISEVYINPPDGSDPDQGREFIEIFNDGTSAATLTGLNLIVIENEGSNRGKVDAIIPLDSAGSTLAAGRKLVIRDEDVNGFLAEFDPDYSVSNPPLEIVMNMDLENEGGNFAIVGGFSSTLNTDLDTDNNGVLNSTPWTSVIDWVTIHEGAGDSYNYSPAGSHQTVVTSINFETVANPSNPDVFARVYTKSGTTYTAVADGIITEVSRTGLNNNFIAPRLASSNALVTLSGTSKVSPGAQGDVFSFTLNSVPVYHP